MALIVVLTRHVRESSSFPLGRADRQLTIWSFATHEEVTL